MSELSIKINLANRVYPLTVKREEEEGIRRTAKMINDRIKDYENDYAVKDKQDLLAMCALEYGTSSDGAKQQWSQLESLLTEIKELNIQVKETLKLQ